MIVTVIPQRLGCVHGNISDGLEILTARGVEQCVQFCLNFLAHAFLHLCPGLQGLLSFLLGEVYDE